MNEAIKKTLGPPGTRHFIGVLSLVGAVFGVAVRGSAAGLIGGAVYGGLVGWAGLALLHWGTPHAAGASATLG